jgi:hypothetical protein
MANTTDIRLEKSEIYNDLYLTDINNSYNELKTNTMKAPSCDD